jgi:hypothetical protein
MEEEVLISSHTLDCVGLLVAECGFPLGRRLLGAYPKRMPTIIKLEEDLFLTEGFEDFYHASMYHEKLTLDFALRNSREGSVFVIPHLTQIADGSLFLARQSRNVCGRYLETVIPATKLGLSGETI